MAQLQAAAGGSNGSTDPPRWEAVTRGAESGAGSAPADEFRRGRDAGVTTIEAGGEKCAPVGDEGEGAEGSAKTYATVVGSTAADADSATQRSTPALEWEDSVVRVRHKRLSVVAAVPQRERATRALDDDAATGSRAPRPRSSAGAGRRAPVAHGMDGVDGESGDVAAPHVVEVERPPAVPPLPLNRLFDDHIFDSASGGDGGALPVQADGKADTTACTYDPVSGDYREVDFGVIDAASGVESERGSQRAGHRHRRADTSLSYEDLTNATAYSDGSLFSSLLATAGGADDECYVDDVPSCDETLSSESRSTLCSPAPASTSTVADGEQYGIAGVAGDGEAAAMIPGATQSGAAENLAIDNPVYVPTPSTSPAVTVAKPAIHRAHRPSQYHSDDAAEIPKEGMDTEDEELQALFCDVTNLSLGTTDGAGEGAVAAHSKLMVKQLRHNRCDGDSRPKDASSLPPHNSRPHSHGAEYAHNISGSAVSGPAAAVGHVPDGEAAPGASLGCTASAGGPKRPHPSHISAEPAAPHRHGVFAGYALPCDAATKAQLLGIHEGIDAMVADLRGQLAKWHADFEELRTWWQGLDNNEEGSTTAQVDSLPAFLDMLANAMDSSELERADMKRDLKRLASELAQQREATQRAESARREATAEYESAVDIAAADAERSATAIAALEARTEEQRAELNESQSMMDELTDELENVCEQLSAAEAAAADSAREATEAREQATSAAADFARQLALKDEELESLRTAGTREAKAARRSAERAARERIREAHANLVRSAESILLGPHGAAAVASPSPDPSPAKCARTSARAPPVVMSDVQ